MTDSPDTIILVVLAAVWLFTLVMLFRASRRERLREPASYIIVYAGGQWRRYDVSHAEAVRIIRRLEDAGHHAIPTREDVEVQL